MRKNARSVDVLPSPELLRQVLNYDPLTGELTWKYRDISTFKEGTTERIVKSTNSQRAGKTAFTYINCDGYREGSVNGVSLFAHRVIWAIIHGKWPQGDVDHEFGQRDNNLALRDVSTSMNCRNAKGKSNNVSGVTGVSWRKQRRKWQARMMINYKERHLGYFDNKEEARAVVVAARKEHGFTDRHGTFE